MSNNWRNPYTSSITDPTLRRIFASLEAFLASPYFNEGVSLGPGPGSGAGHDATTGAVTPVVTTNINTSNIDLTANDGAAPGQVAGVSLTGGIRSLFVRFTARTETDMVNGQGTYQVQVATDNLFASIVHDGLASSNLVSVDGLTTGTTYYVRVRAIDAYGGTGVWSATASVTIPTINTADITANAITTNLLAANSVTAAKLAAVTMEVGKYLQSTNYNGTDVETGNATAGFRIQANGNCEFWNGIFRGSVTGATITGGIVRTAASGERMEMNANFGMEFRFYSGLVDSTYGYIFHETVGNPGNVQTLTLTPAVKTAHAAIRPELRLYYDPDLFAPNRSEMNLKAEKLTIDDYTGDERNIKVNGRCVLNTPYIEQNRGFTSPISCATGATVTVPADTNVIADVGGWIQYNTGDDTLQPLRSGLYKITAMVTWAANSAGRRSVILEEIVTAVGRTVALTAPAPSGSTTNYAEAVFNFTAGSFHRVRIRASQNSGFPVDVHCESFAATLIRAT